MKRCGVAIRRPGEPEGSAAVREVPTVWFPSMATMAAVLSEDNQAMPRIICDQRPKSLIELAELAGRQVSNLSRTLRMMEGYGLVFGSQFYERIALSTNKAAMLEKGEVAESGDALLPATLERVFATGEP